MNSPRHAHLNKAHTGKINKAYTCKINKRYTGKITKRRIYKVKNSLVTKKKHNVYKREKQSKILNNIKLKPWLFDNCIMLIGKHLGKTYKNIYRYHQQYCQKLKTSYAGLIHVPTRHYQQRYIALKRFAEYVTAKDLLKR